MILKRNKVARLILGMIRQHAPRVVADAGGGLVVARHGTADFVTLTPEILAKLAALPPPTLPTTSGANVQLGPTSAVSVPTLPVMGPADV